MDSFWIGVFGVFAGAAMQGSFALPQKFIRGWAWEKIWLFYSISGMIVVPWLLLAGVIPQPAAVYSNVGAATLARTALFGAGWGVGSVLFGLGLASVGLALGFAIIISLTAAIGALVPMLVLHPEQMGTTRGLLLVIGLAVAIAGVVLCSKAGALRDAAKRGAAASSGSFGRGLIICIASGVTSPMMNFAFAFGTPISQEAVRLGASPTDASIATFAIALASGFVINAGYCVYLLGRNRTWHKGQAGAGARNTGFAFAMGALWLMGWYFYGLGATKLGPLGDTLGWPMFMTTMVLIANLWGLATGEWKGAGRMAFRYLGAGLAVMIAALMVIGAGMRP